MQLRRVAWDLYVQISTFIAWEMSNDRFTILEHARVTKKKKQTKVLMQAQINKQGCSCEHKRIYIYIYIYICDVHLGLLPQTSSSGTCLPSLSLPILVRLLPACLIIVGYVCEICMICLHVQLSKDMCTNSVLYGICAYIFNSWRICAQVLCTSFLTCMGFRACMFNSWRICAQILTCIGFVLAYSKICAWILTCIGSVPTYSIPRGYVHKFCVLACLTIFGWKIH